MSPEAVAMPIGTTDPNEKGQAAAGNEAGSKQGGDEFKNDPALVTDRDTLKGKVGDLETKIQEMSELLANPDTINRMFGSSGKPEVKPEVKPDEKPDLNNLSGEQLTDYILKSVGTMFKGEFGKVSEALGGMGQKQEMEKVLGLVNACREKFTDYDTYKSKMIEVSQANPGLSPERVYKISKVEVMEEEAARVEKENAENKSPDKPEANASEQKVLSIDEAAKQSLEKLDEKLAKGE